MYSKKKESSFRIIARLNIWCQQLRFLYMFVLCWATHLLTSCRIHIVLPKQSYVCIVQCYQELFFSFFCFFFSSLLISEDLFTRQSFVFYVYHIESHLFPYSLTNNMCDDASSKYIYIYISFINYTFLIGLYVQSNVEDCNLTRKTIVDFSTHHTFILAQFFFFCSLYNIVDVCTKL